MFRTDGIPDVGAGRIIAVLIGKYAFEHEEFFTTAVHMSGEGAVRRVANE